MLLARLFFHTTHTRKTFISARRLHLLIETLSVPRKHGHLKRAKPRAASFSTFRSPAAAVRRRGSDILLLLIIIIIITTIIMSALLLLFPALQGFLVAPVCGFDEGSGEGYSEFEPVVQIHYTPKLDYKNPRWCHTFSLQNGEVTCHSPLGGHHRSTLGTRCKLTCDHGSQLVGPAAVQCLPTRRWSGMPYCRQIRCHVLPTIYHGTLSCTDGVLVDSRCDYTCDPGYQIEGDRTRTCLEEGKWSGTEPTCEDHDPPMIKCPRSRVKIAAPGKLTVKVTWEPPVVKDTADTRLTGVTLMGQEPGSDFKEGIHVIRYKVYDQARNKATCKFIIRVEVRRCPILKAPLHGYLRCDSGGNNYGAVCEHLCDGGYERRGPATRVCQFNRSWSGSPLTCVTMEINTDVRTAAALLDQFYEKRRLLVVSTPDNSNQYYKLQNIMLQKASCGLDLRQVTVIELLGSPPREVGRIKDRQLDDHVIEELRQVLRISRSYFSLVLLDEYGVDRERFIAPTAADELYYYLDTYILSEEERERLEKQRDYCE
ncbi:sushi repeat-containing protein SRPX2-like isoform X1 [Scleropages formosus]|uniref:Sushi repeat-containing protein SRPX2 n=1 Tax=Scleropages formosus TaxID=113540 RepID=A0A8C9RHL0_SCLFO|nr:sushi repeat-containing protein SRPX2-like isoform X1 [Scleropages formosus]